MIKKYKYDLEIIIPATPEGKYGQRLLDFKNYGLLNVKDKKILVTLLIGPEKYSFHDWPVETRAIQGKHKQETAKTYEFFSNLNPENIQSRWMAKIDDDTINDLSNWVDKLDEEYDYERDFYVVTECRPEQHRYEDNILRSMGYHRWFNPKCTIWHELEGCVVSATAMHKITTNENAKTFLSQRASIPEGYNDYALACAARICKIYPTDAYFMSRHPLIGDLMFFGGYLTHIHEVSHDRNFYVFDLLQRMMKKDMSGGNSHIYKEIVNKEFVYYNGRGMHIIKLNENGVISGQPSDARIWHIKPNGYLEFLRGDGSLICVFDNYENTNFMEGYHEKALKFQGKPQLRKLA
jgi:hypothetical protein